jgi:dCMP deaminase
MSRISFDEYFMEITKLVAKRSTCIRRQVGAIAVKDKTIVSTGYNGAPSGTSHCGEVGCIRDRLKIPSGERHELCKAVHAEQNVIIQAAKNGVSVKCATMYTWYYPCSICTKMIINAGFKEVIYVEDYPDDFSKTLFEESDVVVIQYNT